MTPPNYAYTYAVKVHGKWIEKTVGARSVQGTDKAAWDFARRHYRDPNTVVGKLTRTNDPRVKPEAHNERRAMLSRTPTTDVARSSTRYRPQP